MNEKGFDLSREVLKTKEGKERIWHDIDRILWFPCRYDKSLHFYRVEEEGLFEFKDSPVKNILQVEVTDKVQKKNVVFTDKGQSIDFLGVTLVKKGRLVRIL